MSDELKELREKIKNNDVGLVDKATAIKTGIEDLKIHRKRLLGVIQSNDWVAVEMARRKVAFHNKEHWEVINLWGLFSYTDIKKYLSDGRLRNTGGYKPENKTYWVVPSFQYWEDIIKPIVEAFTLEELQATF